ncbi:MAG: flavin reductase family protein [Candidatus Thorarchaeota archaeon]
MTKQEVRGNLLSPLPVALVGAKVNGKPNYLVIGYISESQLDETKVCGSKSGREFDKSSLFDTFYGELETAPMIQQAPINIECEVTEILDYDQNDGVIGKVVKSYADSEYLTDGKLDWRKVHPILWATGGDFNYYRLGERIIDESGTED